MYSNSTPEVPSARAKTRRVIGYRRCSLCIAAVIAVGVIGLSACGSSGATPATQSPSATVVTTIAASTRATEAPITLLPAPVSAWRTTSLAPASPATAERARVTQAAIAFPIAPGQTENWKAALADLIGPRYGEYQASRIRYGLDQQTTTLQSTPMGDFAVIYMEGADLNKTTEVMATSPASWDVKWRDMTTGLHGADFSDPNALRIDVHLVLNTGDLNLEQKVGLKPLGFMIPLKEDGAREMRQRFEDVMASKGDDYRRSRAKLGIAEEKVFLEKTAIGPALVVYWEAKDPVASLQALTTSSDPFDTWFANEFYNQHLVDSGFLAGMFAKNVLIADYPHR
jgi:hypothetical protein